MYRILKRLYIDEKGQGLVEYAMILFFVAVALVSALIAFRDTLKDEYELINSQMP